MQTGDPIPQGEVQEYPQAAEQYKKYIEADPSLIPWHNFLMRATSMQKKGDVAGLKEMGNKVADAYRKLFRQPALRIPDIQWVQDPGIHRVTGHNFSLPVLVYDRSHIEVYINIQNGMPQGVSTHIPPELIDLPSGSRHLTLVSVPAEEYDRELPMEYTQRMRHELMHAVDPNIHRRTGIEQLIQTELVATIGEVTDNFWDFARVNIDPDFLFQYLRESVPELATTITANKLCDYVRDITSQQHPKTGRRSNADVVRGLMLTTENNELKNIINPPYTPKFTIRRI